MENSKSIYLGILGCAILYAVTSFASAFVGFLNPWCWIVVFPALAAILGAPSYMWAASRWQRFGVAIQNIPEGAIISMPMRAAGNSQWKSFVLGSLSGAVDPIGAVAVLLLTSLLMPVLPYMLAFAAGAMFYVVVEELIPEASTGQHSNLSTIGFAIGFVLMMVLDVVMG